MNVDIFDVLIPAEEVPLNALPLTGRTLGEISSGELMQALSVAPNDGDLRRLPQIPAVAVTDEEDPERW